MPTRGGFRRETPFRTTRAVRLVLWALFLPTWAGRAVAQIDPIPAGRIVVANDNLTLSNAGFEAVSDARIFATNIAAWFTGGRAGTFLVHSNDLGLTGDSLASNMVRAGYGWTVSTSVPFDAATLHGYDGVFLGGFPADNQVLIGYVWDGGNVYLCGGTGAIDEAAEYNGFLTYFGISFGSPDHIAGSIPIANDHQVFAGVHRLFQQDGTNVRLLQSGRRFVLVSQGSVGLYALYDPRVASGVEASTAEAFRLGPAAPNPFWGVTSIRFELPMGAGAHLDIFDAAGHRVTRLLQRDLVAGVHAVRWDGRTQTGAPAAAGVYFYTLESNGSSVSERVVLVRP